MASIAVVMTSEFEDIEFTAPKKSFQDAGHTMTVISFAKGQELKGKQGEAVVTSDLSIDEANPQQFDALLIPGGFSPDQLRADHRFVSFAKDFMFEDKPVFAICHGPQLLITAETLQGRKVTGYISIQQDLKYAGATVFDKEVVTCGNLVTSRVPDDIPAFNQASLAKLAN
ncbi:type 1 glutamine amidotransferase [Bacillaceae bacterium SIJ1]|uniref:type 1 glutamine amidotransferase domain-containing protein n=1 Tax=Litoribacterium kuwaitense TaxID=1398745 RepID=UPI0013E9F658|nr:type 1 glutamine amidotransferase domain-containing protein [Litoribacterium kuwaitense]NGP44844.1 type 1 glutamine amidotransferase [Litoribacterium kuwaitense]